MSDYLRSEHELTHVLLVLHQVMREVLKHIESSEKRASTSLKFHLRLAGRRVNIIVEHLEAALEELNAEPHVELSEKEIEKALGTVAVEAIAKLKKSIAEFIDEAAKPLGKRELNVLHLSAVLTDFAEVLNIAAAFIKLLCLTLEKSPDIHVWRASLALQAVARDMEIIVHMHHQLTSNPDMLAKEVAR
ncbi:MAG: hypothetical protein QFX33_00490 [Candidatus Nezhaarchaeota archaeon]|nr:hypothetical protein [Candidatus Nezhaarchaeota archaeon]